MKLCFTICCLAALSLGLFGADQPKLNPAVPPPTEPAPLPKQSHADLLDISRLSAAELQAMARFQAETVTRILGVRFHVDGVLPEISRSEHPWQWINPMAPASYGIGLGNISTNPRTGRMEGISFISLRF